MDRICIHVYLYTRGRTIERAVVWNGWQTLRAVSLRVLVRECTIERLTQEYAGKSIALPNVVQSSERKFNSGFGAGQGTHRSTRELQCEREGQWRSPKAELL